MLLLADLDLNDVATDAKHGQMTAVVRYETLYTVAGKGPFVLSFALGNDVSLRNALGLLILLVMGTDINWVKGLLSCIKLNRSFVLELQPPGKSLPEYASLNYYSHTIPSKVSTNLTNTYSILHYISAEGIPQPIYLSSPSDNVLVTEHFLEYCYTGAIICSSKILLLLSHSN